MKISSHDLKVKQHVSIIVSSSIATDPEEITDALKKMRINVDSILIQTISK